jgi:hypothetical protein
MIVILICNIFSLLLYIIIGLFTDFRSRIELYWLIILPIYLCYGYILLLVLKEKIGDKIPLLWFVLFSIAFRIAIIPSDPVLSDDIFRYLWDGKIFANGINPYAHAPISDHLSILRVDSFYQYVNFPEIATVYPPVSQFLFLINEYLGGTILSWKILLFGIEVILVIILLKILKHFSLNQTRILIYLFNPLVIIETYGSGHIEICGIMLFWMGVYYFYQNKSRYSIIFFALSIMTKFLSFISTIPFLSKKFARQILQMVTICFVIILPFSWGGVLPVPGLFSYVNRWEFNGAIYKLITAGFQFLDIREYQWMTANLSGHVETFYFSYGFYYKLIALAVLLFVLYDQMRKLQAAARFTSINYIRSSFVVTGLLLLLSPTFYPWYLLWIIPFLIFMPNYAWISLTLLMQLSYYVLKNYALLSVWEESPLILCLQYLPFYIILVWEYLDRRKIKGWFLDT